MSRIDRLKEQNPVLSKSIIDLLSEIDPSGTNKYLEFMIKTVKSDFDGKFMPLQKKITNLFFDIHDLDILNRFNNHLNANRIKKNDIGQYSNLYEMEKEVEKADEIVNLKELEKQTKILVNNDDYLVLVPLSYEAASKYGANTKWCITDKMHWSKYINTCKLIFIIDKINNLKFAMCFDYCSDELTLWNAEDDKISTLSNDIQFDILIKCMSEIRECKKPIIQMDGYINRILAETKISPRWELDIINSLSYPNDYPNDYPNNYTHTFKDIFEIVSRPPY